MQAVLSRNDYVLFCVVIAAIFVLGVVVLVLRRRFHPGVMRPEEQVGFSLDRLEKLRAAGTIAEEEFKVLRRAALGLDNRARNSHNGSSSEGGVGDDETQGGTE